MQNSTPDGVLGPDFWLEQDKVVPEDPEGVVEGQRAKHVNVNCDTETLYGGVGDEDDDGHQETDQRYPEEHQPHPVD